VTLPLLGIVAAYLLGSVPWAYVAGRVLKGIDLREHGSGNLGATNVLRTLGAPAALFVLLADATKGAVPVLWFPRVFASSSAHAWAVAYGVAAIVGHVRPLFLLGRGGGKGVATAAGVFGALAPAAVLIAFAAFALVVLATRFMSLGSLAAAAALPIAIAILRGVRDPVFAAALAIGGLVFWTHRVNIGRLRRGVEPRLGQKPAV
jgi:glycerol-3-phosphate acyltransferase PlsY